MDMLLAHAVNRKQNRKCDLLLCNPVLINLMFQSQINMWQCFRLLQSHQWNGVINVKLYLPLNNFVLIRIFTSEFIEEKLWMDFSVSFHLMHHMPLRNLPKTIAVFFWENSLLPVLCHTIIHHIKPRVFTKYYKNIEPYCLNVTVRAPICNC